MKSFGLRQEKYNKEGHDNNPTRVEQESAELEVTQHCQECLGQDEYGNELHRNSYALPCGSDFQGENLTWY